MTPSRQIKAILFDMDGTLLDTEVMSDKAIILAFGDSIPEEIQNQPPLSHWRIPWEAKKPTLGLGGQDWIPPMLEYAKENWGVKKGPTLEEFWDRWESGLNDMCDEIEECQGATRLVREFARLGIPMAIATSSQQMAVEKKRKKYVEAASLNCFTRCADVLALRHDDMFRHLQAIVTRDDPAIKNGKPAPDLYIEAARRLGVDPRDCLVFEDALAGAQAGKAAGCQVVAIPDERFSKAEKEEFLQEADIVLESLKEFSGTPFGIPLLAETSEQPCAQPPPAVSPDIQATLDPCVVLMEKMISQYAKEWEEKGGIASLAQGVVWWKPPDTCTQRLQKEVSDPDSALHLYGPDEGLPELREALKIKISEENGLQNHDVMISMGANQAYMNCVLAMPKTKAIVFAPVYFNHKMAWQMVGANLAIGNHTVEGIPDLQWLEDQLEADAVVTICNPGNPTGTLLERSFLQQIVNLTRERGAWLILDVTYEYFGDFDGCFDDEPHVIHVFSFSKSYGMAGYRCGYLALHHSSDLWTSILKVQDTIPICPSRISQVAALGALEAGPNWVRDKVGTLQTGRRAILEALEEFPTMGGSGAMYVMANIDADDTKVAERLVAEFGVAIIPGTYCGWPGWIRVCYANLPPDACTKAAIRLKEGLTSILASTE